MSILINHVNPVKLTSGFAMMVYRLRRSGAGSASVKFDSSFAW